MTGTARRGGEEPGWQDMLRGQRGRDEEARRGQYQEEPCLVTIISIFVSYKSIFTLQTRSCLTSTVELAQTVMKVRVLLQQWKL